MQPKLLCAFYSRLLLLGVLVMPQALAVSPQSVTGLDAKQLEQATNPIPEGTLENQYYVLDEGFHAEVLEAIQRLPMPDQVSLQQWEKRVPESIKSVREAVRDEQAAQQRHLNILWQAAVYRSQPIRYAIEKLGQRDASGKIVKNKSGLKKLVNGIAQVGGAAASMVAGNPVGLISGALVSEVLAQSSNPYRKPVTDADMVILARAIDALQQELLTLYLAYDASKAQHALAQERLQKLEAAYSDVLRQRTRVDETQRDLLKYMVNEAKQGEQVAAQAFQAARHALGLKVGNEALVLIETPNTENA